MQAPGGVARTAATGGAGVARPPSSTGGGSRVAGPGTPGGGAPGATPAPGGIPPIDQLQGRPIGRVLTKMGKVTRDQVVEALTFQKSKGGALGRILIDLGYIKDVDLNTALAAQRGYELVNLDGVNIPKEAIDAVPAQLATTNKVLPIAFDKAAKRLTVVMANHENFRALDDLRSLMGYTVTAKVGDPDQMVRIGALDRRRRLRTRIRRTGRSGGVAAARPRRGGRALRAGPRARWGDRRHPFRAALRARRSAPARR